MPQDDSQWSNTVNNFIGDRIIRFCELINGVALDFLIQEKHLNPKQQKMVIQRYFDGITI